MQMKMGGMPRGMGGHFAEATREHGDGFGFTFMGGNPFGNMQGGPSIFGGSR